MRAGIRGNYFRSAVGNEKSPPKLVSELGGAFKKIPAITDFRAKGTIMGLAGLTAVFGMGTGVAPQVWSPEKWPAGGKSSRPRHLVVWS